MADDKSKWEYYLFSLFYDDGQLEQWVVNLDEYGRDGWEVVGEITLNRQMQAAPMEYDKALLLKRPVPWSGNG